MRAQGNPAAGAQRGFTLIELSVVMIIVAFLIGGLIYTLAAQVEQRNFEETRRRLEQARELILAFAITNGRLPCPARSAATASPATVAGDEVLTTTGTVGCIGDGTTDFYGGTSGGVTLGLLPARSIGYQQVDSSGFAVDAWGNRLRYAVANLITNCSGSSTLPHFTNAQTSRPTASAASRTICSCASHPPASRLRTAAPSAASVLTRSCPRAWWSPSSYSTGKNGADAAGGTDEAANLNGDRVFVYHTPTPSDRRERRVRRSVHVDHARRAVRQADRRRHPALTQARERAAARSTPRRRGSPPASGHSRTSPRGAPPGTGRCPSRCPRAPARAAARPATSGRHRVPAVAHVQLATRCCRWKRHADRAASLCAALGERVLQQVVGDAVEQRPRHPRLGADRAGVGTRRSAPWYWRARPSHQPARRHARCARRSPAAAACPASAAGAA